MNETEFWNLVDSTGGPAACWPWLGGQNGDGRGRIKFNGRQQYAYRIAWELATGLTIGPGLVARHRCDNPRCVNPLHIIPGTQAQNARDAKDRGRARTTPRYGADHHACRVPTEKAQRAVEEYRAGGQTQAQIAAKYGVTQSTLSLWNLGKVRADEIGT